MSDLQQQLPVIDRLRSERDDFGQKMFALRTQIARTSAALRKSRQIGERRVGPTSQEIADARSEIARDEVRLRELAGAEQDARRRLVRFEDSQRQAQFLQRSLDSLRTSLEDLRAMLEVERQHRPPEWKAIAGIEAAIESTEARIADAERSLAAAQEGDNQREADAAAARRELRSIAEESAQLREQIAGKAEEIGVLRDASGPTAPQLEEHLASLNEQYRATKTKWQAVRNNLQNTIAAIYVDPHPRSIVAQMPDATPFLLLPIRIETRFVVRHLAGGPVGELLLRVYPDDIAVHTHESELTDREVEAGEKYWRKLFDIETGTTADKPAARTDAWKTFAVIFGPARSAWVARNTRPTNWAVVSTLASADDLVFPAHDLTKTSAWSRAPRTGVLPDRFVVLLYQGETLAKEVVGRQIPDELILGPEPLDLVANADQEDVEDSFVTDNGQLTFGANFDWASNFDRAVELGMGFRIPISAGAAWNGYDKIVVLGVMASADASAGQEMIETLLENHHHSPNGLTVLRQGTATNNMDGEGSGYSVNDALNETKEVTGEDPPVFIGEPTDTDGHILATALGISYDQTFKDVFNSDATDYREAVAMNRGLYPATLGYYFDSLLPVIPEGSRQRLREFFISNVVGRGPVAAIRVGDQPYGILLTSDFKGWKETPHLVKRDRFLSILHAALKHFDGIWEGIIPQLNFAGKAGLTTTEALLNILGLQASSVTFAQRVAYSSEYLSNLEEFEFGGSEFSEIWKTFSKGNSITNWMRTLGYNPATLGLTERPELLNLVYQHYTTAIDGTNLIDSVPLSETAGIREYESATHKNYLDWLHDASTLEALAAQNFGGAPVPSALLYLKLRHALLLQLHKATVALLRVRGYDASATMAPKTFHNIRPRGDIGRWELMSAPVSAVGMSPAAGKVALANYLMSTPSVVDEGTNLEEMRAAIETLAKLPTARLERCFTEHIDACTYRLDAWQTGLFKTRLDAMRAGSTQTGSKTGIYVGAFGWVENVRPSPSWVAVSDIPEKLKSPNNTAIREYAGNGGFVHAPSINHANAAALLRSGYMSHATLENPDIMSVNVSSERVRRALFILEGMRNGQSIEALLGYQFERGIHDRASADNSLQILNGLLFDIRVAYPIERVRLGGGTAGGVEETVEAYDVVNGVNLVDGGAPDWAAITGAGPDVLTSDRLAALNGEREKAADTLDAIKDLLLAESAFQLMQGNFDRAGAVLSSIKEARVPPDLDVIKTPRSSHFTFTHRVAIHFGHLDPLDPNAAGWAGDVTPRARLEPGLNRWLADVLGPPDNIVMTVSEIQENAGVETTVNPAVLTAADLGLQPIDLVSIVGADASTGAGARTGASELESRVAWRYRADHDLSETVRVQIQFAEPKNQAGKLTMLEVLPLMHHLHSLLSDSRALDARDYHTTTTRGAPGTGATPSQGYDFADMRGRAVALQNSLDEVLGDILPLPFTAIIGGWPVATLEEAFRELKAREVDLASVFFDFTTGDALTLQQLLLRLSNFAIADAFPRIRDVTTNEGKVGLVMQAMDATAVAIARKTASAKVLADADASAADSSDRAVSIAVGACKAILGADFVVLPAFVLADEADVIQSHNDHAQLIDFATNTLNMRSPEDEWMRSVAYVRPKIAAWDRIRLLHETLLGTTLDTTAIQLPYRGGDSWLAVEFPPIDAATGDPFDVTHDTISMVTHGAAAFAAGSLRAGILIDSFTETVPAREQSTGIAFNYNRPNAMPPQALLLAVPPEVTGHWSWDALVNIVNDTLRRAKLRAVEPELLDKLTGHFEVGVLLPAIISEFQQFDLNVSLDYRLNVMSISPTLATMYANPIANS